MKMTSAEAAKLLKKTNEEITALKDREQKTMTFIASLGEDVESVRPLYDYVSVQGKLKELEKKVRCIKHAINIFNQTTEISDIGMTVDQALVYIPQLTERKQKLIQMAARLPKERASSGYGMNIVEYQYANYSIELAEADLQIVTDELSKAQTALDVINNSVLLEIEL